jgi:arachidonate 15-lipoxygenase
MTYTPAAPTAVYRAAPTNVADALLSDPLDMYPPMDMAQLQLEFLTLLGTAYYTQLGQYEPGLFPPALAPALATFQAALKTIEANVDVANRSRYAYAFLKPSLIPQSINV